MKFLILGTPSCQYCLKAKEALIGASVKGSADYEYVDLDTVYGSEWRRIFTLLTPLIRGARTIPLIFRGNGDLPILSKDTETEFRDQLAKWTFIGGYGELLTLLDDELELSDDY